MSSLKEIVDTLRDGYVDAQIPYIISALQEIDRRLSAVEARPIAGSVELTEEQGRTRAEDGAWWRTQPFDLRESQSQSDETPILLSTEEHAARLEGADPTQSIPWPSRAVVEALYQLKVKLTTGEQREAMRALEREVHGPGVDLADPAARLVPTAKVPNAKDCGASPSSRCRAQPIPCVAHGGPTDHGSSASEPAARLARLEEAERSEIPRRGVCGKVAVSWASDPAVVLEVSPENRCNVCYEAAKTDRVRKP